MWFYSFYKKESFVFDFSKCFLVLILCLLFFMDLNKVFPLLSLTPFLFKAGFDVLSFFCPFIWYSRWVDSSEHSIFLHCPPFIWFLLLCLKLIYIYIFVVLEGPFHGCCCCFAFRGFHPLFIQFFFYITLNNFIIFFLFYTIYF